MMTDPISDMLTRIRNANQRQFKTVTVPNSKIKLEMVKILKDEGYISEFKVEKNSRMEKKSKIRVEEKNKTTDKNKVKKKIKAADQTHINITLKYKEKQRVIWGLKRISKPGLRVYVKNTEVPKVLSGLGIALISTSKGIMTDRNARQAQLGGEVLAFVW